MQNLPGNQDWVIRLTGNKVFVLFGTFNGADMNIMLVVEWSHWNPFVYPNSRSTLFEVILVLNEGSDPHPKNYFLSNLKFDSIR